MQGRITVALGVVACALALGPPGATAAACPDPGRHVADGNDCHWVGTPSYISGTSVYSRGEFIYSDYVHDDYGANTDGFQSGSPDIPQPITGVYPNLQDLSSPRFGSTGSNGLERFRHTGDYGYPPSGPAGAPTGYNDVADILEFREALDHGQMHFLVRLGAMTSPDSTVIGIGIDADRNPATGAGAWPLGANMNQQLGYDYFITLWGTGGEITDYTKSPAVTTPVRVVANTDARPPFIEADVPLPAGANPDVWRTYVGSGLWDATVHSWRTALPTASQTGSPGSLAMGPNIYNLLFRPYEPNNWWRDTTQANDLAKHDISADHADIDMHALAQGASSAPPHPTGLLNIQYRTIPLGSGQGEDGNGAVIVPAGSEVYKGPIQPYTLVLPSNYYTNPHPRRFVFFYHCANCNQNIWPFGVEDSATPGSNHLTNADLATTAIQNIVDTNDIMVGGALQRGEEGPGSTYGDIPGAGERDLRDIYNTIITRDHYSVDPNRVIFSGMSMGGSTTDAMMTLYPDELAAAVAHSSSFSTPARLQNIRNVYYMQITGDQGLDSTASTAGRQTASQLAAMGFRHMYIEYLGRSHDFNLVYESLPIVSQTGWKQVRDPNPARVTFERDAAMEDPKLGLVHDHAYWASGLTLAQAATTGTIDATALPLAHKLPTMTSHLQGTFSNPQTGNNTYVDWLEYNRDLTGHGLQDFQPGWQPGPDVKVTNTKLTAPDHAGENAFDLQTTSLAGTTLDLDRMSVAVDRRVTGYLKADHPLALALCAATIGRPRVATLDGQPISPSLSGDCLAVAAPAGEHTLVLDGWPALSIRSASSGACASRRHFRLRFVHRHGSPLVSARVFVNGHRVKSLHGRRLSAPIDLRGLPKGAFTVTIKARTRSGRLITAKRRYHTCARKRRGPRHHKL